MRFSKSFIAKYIIQKINPFFKLCIINQPITCTTQYIYQDHEKVLVIRLKNNSANIGVRNCNLLYICKFFIFSDYGTKRKKRLSFKGNCMLCKKKRLPIDMVSRSRKTSTIFHFCSHGSEVKIAVYSSRLSSLNKLWLNSRNLHTLAFKI